MADNNIVEIKGHSYSLTAVPEATSPMVVQARAQVLGSLKLTEMVNGLSRARGLLNLAYHGVAVSGDLRGRVRQLQDKLMVLAGDAEATMDSLATNSSSIVGALRDTFKMLLMGKEEFAIRFLTNCSKYAHDLASKAGTLADRFEALGNDASSTLKDTQSLQGVQESEKRRLADEQAEAERRSKVLKEQVKLLVDDKAELQAKYEEVKAAAETAEGRAFALGMVSAILKPLADGLGAAAGAYAASGGGTVPPGLPKAAAAPASGATKPKDDPVKEKSAPGVDALLASLAAPAPKTPPKANAALTAQDEAVLKELAAGKTDAPSEPQAGGGAGAGTVRNAIAAAGGGESSGGSDYSRIAEGYQKQKIEYMKMMQQVRQQERDALTSIVDFAEKMKRVNDVQVINNNVLDALHQAVGALQSVVVVLRQSQLFWAKMKTQFDNLSQSGVVDKIDAYKGVATTVEERRDIYLDPDFAEGLLIYVAGWHAMHLIAVEYAGVAAKVRTGIEADYQLNPRPEEAMKAVPQIAQMLLSVTTPDLEATKRDEQQLSAEIQRVAA